jgi:hypothetical protein
MHVAISRHGVDPGSAFLCAGLAGTLGLSDNWQGSYFLMAVSGLRAHLQNFTVKCNSPSRHPGMKPGAWKVFARKAQSKDFW